MIREADTSTRIERGRLEEVGVRFLKPEATKLFRGTFSLLHAQVIDERTGRGEIYRGVFAVLAFPVTSPGKFVSLRYHREKDKEEEIGMIEDPMEFPSEARSLLAESLANQYFEYEVTRVLDVEWKYGLLFFDVDTAQGPRQFEMRWQVDRTQDYGTHGKVLLDVYDSRYIIKDLRNLPNEDLERLTRYIYW